MRLGQPSVRRRAVAPRGGPKSRRLGPSAAVWPTGQVSPPPLKSGRGGAVLAGLSLLVAFALLALLLAPGPDAPPAPSASAPPLRLPHASGPRVRLPSIHTPPAVGPPTIPGVSVGAPTLPTVHLPNVGSKDESSMHSEPVDEGPARRTEPIHVHHRLWIWSIDPWLLALLLGGAGLFWLVSRRIRPDRRLLAAAIATALIALAAFAFAAGINQAPGPGTYHQRAPKIERSEDLILTKIETDHYHAPTYLELHWLIAGICLTLLAIPPGRIAAAPWRRRGRRESSATSA